MKTICILNGTGTGSCTELLLDGRHVAELTAGRAVGHFDALVVISGASGIQVKLPEEVELRSVPGEDMHGVLRLLLEHYPGYDNYLFADLYAPFFDPALGVKFAEINSGEIAHYTYGEHYPRGIAPQVLSAEAVQILAGVSSGSNRPFDDEGIMDLMGLDINAYDIEIDVSPVDFRRHRLDLRARSRISCRLLEQLAAAAGGVAGLDYPALTELLISRPELLRTLPAFVELDLSDNCSLRCRFCPREAAGLSGVQDRPFVDFDRVARFAEELAELNPEAVVSLSPYSEPLLHPRFRDIAQLFREHGFRLLVETNGLQLDDRLVSYFAEWPAEQLIVIVSLDSLNSAQYREWKGEADYDRLMANIGQLFTLKPRNSFVQVLHMQGLEEEVDGFYRFWKEHQERVLPRKYNSWCGRLPERRLSDLSPLQRGPCWHLQRDLVVRSDGQVMLCKQDLTGAYPRGNVYTEGLSAVWERLNADYAEHLDSGFSRPALCDGCDEWYTFNS